MQERKGKSMSDYIIRATAAGGQIRAFVATTKEIVEKARQLHNTSPVATAALGRLLTAGAMMGVMMKGDKDILTLQIRGTGPIKGIVVTADSNANVKGYVFEPNVIIPANKNGKLDVGEALGAGMLSVTRDLGMKEPYSSQTNLVTGEIAEDLTHYFANSEQVPSAVALGVLLSKENTVEQAGGFIIQLMPFAEDKIAEALESRIMKISSITNLQEQGMKPEDILKEVLGELEIDSMETIPTGFLCNCDRERVSKALIAVGTKEINEMISEGKDVELKCHFCNTDYIFNIDELNELKKQAK